MSFPRHLRERAADALRTIREVDRRDVYVVSFFGYDEDDDPRRPTLTVGTNTETQVRLAMDAPGRSPKPNRWPSPLDEEEARWNYAFWLQNELTVVAGPGDAAGGALRKSWIRTLGLWFEDDDYSQRAEEAGARIAAEFVTTCVEAVQWMHSSGLIRTVFGRPIPVIVHELEYYSEIADQNVRANGRDLTDGLSKWIAHSGD